MLNFHLHEKGKTQKMFSLHSIKFILFLALFSFITSCGVLATTDAPPLEPKGPPCDPDLTTGVEAPSSGSFLSSYPGAFYPGTFFSGSLYPGIDSRKKRDATSDEENDVILKEDEDDMEDVMEDDNNEKEYAKDSDKENDADDDIDDDPGNSTDEGTDESTDEGTDKGVDEGADDNKDDDTEDDPENDADDPIDDDNEDDIDSRDDNQLVIGSNSKNTSSEDHVSPNEFVPVGSRSPSSSVNATDDTNVTLNSTDDTNATANCDVGKKLFDLFDVLLSLTERPSWFDESASSTHRVVKRHADFRRHDNHAHRGAKTRRHALSRRHQRPEENEAFVTKGSRNSLAERLGHDAAKNYDAAKKYGAKEIGNEAHDGKATTNLVSDADGGIFFKLFDLDHGTLSDNNNNNNKLETKNVVNPSAKISAVFNVTSGRKNIAQTSKTVADFFLHRFERFRTKLSKSWKSLWKVIRQKAEEIKEKM